MDKTTVGLNKQSEFVMYSTRLSKASEENFATVSALEKALERVLRQEPTLAKNDAQDMLKPATQLGGFLLERAVDLEAQIRTLKSILERLEV